MQTLLLCIKIFLARIADVSIGVIRTVELVKDNTFKAVVLAFFEVFIWILIAREALININILVAIFYSLGYAVGTLIGSYLSKLLIKGTLSVQVISSKIKLNDMKNIKENGYGLTNINLDNNKKLLLIEVNKKKLNNIINIIKNIDSKAFITVSDTKYIKNGFIK